MSSSSSFAALERKCEAGEVRIVFVLGLARGGTTAIEKYLYETLPFDGQLNEPSLLGPPPGAEAQAPSEASRSEATFGRVLAHVEGLLAESGRGVTVLVKEVTNKVVPSMVEQWARLAKWWVVVVRNPLLQMESRLKSMLDRIDSGALAQHGLRRESLSGAMHVAGRRVFAEMPAVPTWSAAYVEMKRARDFSGLGAGAMRACTLHPFCEWPESQEAMLGVAVGRDLSGLSDEQCERIVDWRLGWTALAQQLAALELVPTQPDLVIVDFSSVQADGAEALVDRLRARVFEDGVPAGGGNKAAFETCANGDLWSTGDWDKWYAAPCFEKATKARAIEPPSKVPLSPEKFPPFLRPKLESACRAWADLLRRDPRALPPPRAALRAPFLGLDPLYDAVSTRRRAAFDRALRALLDPAPASRPSPLAELLAAALVAVAQACMLLQCAVAFVWEQRIRIVATPWLLLKYGEYPIPADALLSVVVPARNEAAHIRACLRALLDKAKDRKHLEVVVVDAASTDGTRQVLDAEFAADDAVRVVDYLDGGGRGPTLLAGAQAARGTLLFFLHADTLVPDDYDDAIRAELEDPAVEIAAFAFQTTYSRDSRAARVLEHAVNWRSRVLRLPWGDQGLAITKRRFFALDGGFKPIPVFEDLDFVVRARAAGAYRGRRVVTLDKAVTTSARRYADLYAFVLNNLLNAFLLAWWHLGATPNQLFRLYYGKTIARQSANTHFRA